MMKTRLELRALRAEDLPAICELSAQLGYPTSLESMQKRLARILERPEQALFVAARGGHVAGWVHAEAQHPLESDPYVEIVGLVVAEADRRCGVGSALVDRVRHWALELSYPALRVRSNVRRDEAHEFYPALGFQLVKTQHTYALDLAR
jgi:ribosomal protein S18 acetylase RimI-like enzyme